MCDIPLDLERKFEERWAARFVRPVSPITPKEQDLEGQDQQLSAPVSVVPPDHPSDEERRRAPEFH
jgi:hypothetical protein